MKKKIVLSIALVLVIALSVVVLCACGGPNCDPAVAKATLKEKGYAAIDVPNYFDVEGVENIVRGKIVVDNKVDMVTIVYFESADAADDAWNKVREKAFKENKSDDGTDWFVVKKGDMIYYGTKQAIKDAE